MTELAIVAILRRPQPGCVPFSTSEAAEGVSLPIDELTALAKAFPGLHSSILDAVAPRMERCLEISPGAAAVFARRSIVPLTHFLMDRAVRLDRLVKRHRGKRLFAAQAPALRPTKTIGEFSALAGSSASFNLSALNLLAGALGLDCRPFPHETEPFAPPKAHASFQNFNLTGSTAFDKVRKRLHRYAAKALATVRSAWKGRVPALSMTYHEDALEAAGLLGRRKLARLDLAAVPAGDATPDDVLRRRVFRDAFPSGVPAAERFLREAGVDGPAAAAASALLGGLLADMTPASLLESVPERLRAAESLLKPYAGRPLVVSGTDERRGLPVVAAARGLGMEVIGCQHGGGYGQFDLDQMCTRSVEAPLYDRFITWGWNKFPDGIAAQGIEAVPLPVPWLSHGAKAWRRELRGGTALDADRPYDVFFMCDRVSPFSEPPMGLEVIRTDLLADHTALLKDLVAETSRRGIRVLHKPYTEETVALLEGTFAELERLGGDRYTRVRRLDKGLDPSLLKQCRLVLLMRPSTTFQQCLVAGVPVMVLWPRHIIGESPCARRAFAGLESCGIVHHDPAGFCEAYLGFRASPKDWMRDPRRVKAVARFLRQFGWARPDWRRFWARFLIKL